MVSYVGNQLLPEDIPSIAAWLKTANAIQNHFTISFQIYANIPIKEQWIPMMIVLYFPWMKR